MSLKDKFAKKKLLSQQKKAQRRGELTSAESLMNQGVEHGKSGHYAEALDCFNQAIQLNPKLAEAYANRGIVYFKQKNHSQALADYDKAIQLNPQCAEAYYSRGTIAILYHTYVIIKNLILNKATQQE